MQLNERKDEVYMLPYFSTTEKPYWRDNGKTPTALQTEMDQND